MKVTGNIETILNRKGGQTWSVAPEDTVLAAITLMAEKNIGALPVVEGGRLCGMISERDYTRKVALKGRSSRDTRVREIMSTTLTTVTRHQSVDECLRLMTERRVRHLPVLEGERMVGLVSIGDLVNYVISAQSAAIGHLEDYISGKYPG